MQISLIITTYNWKEALELSLQSGMDQKVLPMEIIVADDGSNDDTGAIVRKMAKDSPVPIVHSWQNDKGFRLARSRNKAIARARGNYVVLIDGDIIMDPYFIGDHSKFAKQGFFIQGTRVLLKEELSNQVLQRGSLKSSWCMRGVENRKNCLRCDMLARLFSFQSKILGGVKTCNFAFWRNDAIAINGFNEDFIGWGREDSEFTARLMNNGVKRQNVKFNALGYHLYHSKNDRNRLEANDQILQETIRQKLCWCENGLHQHLPAEK